MTKKDFDKIFKVQFFRFKTLYLLIADGKTLSLFALLVSWGKHPQVKTILNKYFCFIPQLAEVKLIRMGGKAAYPGR